MLPNARLRPIAETRVHAHPVAEGARQIAPRAARAGDPQHCFDKQPVVIAAPAGIARLAKTKRLHLRPLGVSQNESVHSKLESQSSPDENPESKQTLERFQAKWKPVRVKKTRQNKNLEPRFDSIETEKALVPARSVDTMRASHHDLSD